MITIPYNRKNQKYINTQRKVSKKKACAFNAQAFKLSLNTN
ncbi:hypothetical protein SAMN05444338_10786 [Flavobacterium degerlachei]|uniref:Uncharacterized protein n=1 Tax=Flavobacterium degerlachei TaxID=229203 RepID=A0A1H2Z6U9_9FLAO|nr:hypothetical protein SAMN05444338_10786 [Flavobacterium degerlachei]